jgi:hypothetical protein
MTPRLVARVDANQKVIVDACRDVGATVQHLHQLGQGVPDILVGYRGINYLVEIKDGDKPPSERRLTGDEQKWHDLWRGQVAVVESIDDTLRLIGAIK